MAKAVFGTDMFTGLNVGAAAHKLAPHELQVSEQGWTDQEGAWRTSRGPLRLYQGYSAISCFAAGRMNGEDHLVWMDGNTLYDNGVNVGTITAGSSMKIIAIDDAFLILGAAVNYIWDGDHVREQGCWQPSDVSNLYLQKGTFSEFGTKITDVTAANPGVCSCIAHELEVGDHIYIDNLATMTELNGRKFLVTATTTNTFTINEDTSEYTAESGGITGTYKRYMGLDGTYKWCYTCTVELSDGRVLESRPRGFRFNEVDGIESDSWTPEEITLTETDVVYIGQSVQLFGSIEWIDDSVQNFAISGTIGTDYHPGVRIYRTKADGESDYYLEREYRHGDDNLLYVSSTDAAYFFLHEGDPDNYGCFLGASDKDLGAVLTHELNEHVNPPASSLAAAAGQRVFLNDRDNPDRYYWSHLDGIEYYTELGWGKMPDTITLMEPLDRVLVMASQDRIWVDTFTDGLPDVREIRTDTGSATGIATTTDDGVLFLEEDGLWLFDGAQVVKISRRGFDTLEDPASITARKDIVYMSGVDDSYVVRQRDSGMIWHGGNGTYPLCDSTGNGIYAASDTEIVQLFAGAYRGGTMKTAKFHLGTSDSEAIRLMIDMEGASVPTVWVNGNRQSSPRPHLADSTHIEDCRRIVWVNIPRLVNHVIDVQLEATGDLIVYGVWGEVAR